MSDYRIVTGRRKQLEERIAELEHDIDQYRKIDKDMLKRIAALEATIKRVEKHKDSKILECQCLQEVVDKNLISIKAIRELPEKWRKYTFDNPEATSYIDSADCADELEALLPEEQTNEQ